MDYKLTQFSHGAGCGCKISPAILDEILKSDQSQIEFKSLLVGNHERDDAAVFDLGDGTSVISTTDFFMPIVDDAFDFGRIAAANAISDVYAMGGDPIMAIAILGWPIDKLPPEVANQVIEGGRAMCKEAGIPLAGGHSIDAPEPIFGLAVTGKIRTDAVKKNGGAKPGDLLYLTKPLGVGILSTAMKKGLLDPAHTNIGRDNMVKLNKIGASFSKVEWVNAMTDVTGFGLLGHLIEMCEASGTSAQIHFDQLPILPEVQSYLTQGAIPGGTKRNLASYGHKLGDMTDDQKHLMADPQTSGGLLIAVDETHGSDFVSLCQSMGYDLSSIGKVVGKVPKTITLS